MNNKSKLIISFAGLLLLVLGGYTYYRQQNPVISEVSYESEYLTPDGKKVYSSSTLGLSFEYPSDWRIQIDSEDPVTHGDIMLDGKIYTSFNAGVFPPNWGSENNSYINFSHSPLVSSKGKSYDNLSVAEQLKFFSCEEYLAFFKEHKVDFSNTCKSEVNKNGVQYIKYTQNMSGQIDRPEDGYNVSVVIPTGKYVITIVTVSVEDKGAPIFSVLDQIIESIKLQ